MQNMKCENGKCDSGCMCCGNKCADWALLILRLVLAAVFISAGYNKLFGMGGPAGFGQMLASLGIPLAGLFGYLVPVVELLGGIAMLVGAYTKQAGYLLAIIMLVATLAAKKLGWPAIQLDLSLLAMSLAVAFLGPGSMAIAGGKMGGKCLGGKCMGSSDKK